MFSIGSFIQLKNDNLFRIVSLLLSEVQVEDDIHRINTSLPARPRGPDLLLFLLSIISLLSLCETSISYRSFASTIVSSSYYVFCIHIIK